MPHVVHQSARASQSAVYAPKLRTFAWLGNFRRLVVRGERHITMYRAFFHVACLLITLRQL
jgi:transposase